jgi:hypothetical protein
VVIGKLAEYVERAGGDWALAQAYLANQAAGSWTKTSVAAKGFLLSEARPLPEGAKVYWGPSSPGEALDTLRRLYPDAEDQQRYRVTMTALHAFTHELLARAEMPVKEGNTIRLFRTEDEGVMRKHKLKPGATNVSIPRGYLESFSVWVPVRVYGTEHTVQRVPIHRVFATYLHERYPGHGNTALYNDNENEFLVIPEGILFDYADPRQRQRRPPPPWEPSVGKGVPPADT